MPPAVHSTRGGTGSVIHKPAAASPVFVYVRPALTEELRFGEGGVQSRLSRLSGDNGRRRQAPSHRGSPRPHRHGRRGARLPLPRRPGRGPPRRHRVPPLARARNSRLGVAREGEARGHGGEGGRVRGGAAGGGRRRRRRGGGGGRQGVGRSGAGVLRAGVRAEGRARVAWRGLRGRAFHSHHRRRSHPLPPVGRGTR